MDGPVCFTIAELVFQDVVRTLSGICVQAGYQNDLEVEELKQGGNTPKRDRLVIVGAGDAEPTADPPLGDDEYLLTIGIHACVIEPGAHEPAYLRGRLSSVAADIRRALKRDLHRGGLACNTEFPDKDEFSEQGTPPGVIVWPKVRFRTLFNDPYRQEE